MSGRSCVILLLSHMNGASWAMEFQIKTMASSGLLLVVRLLCCTGVNIVDVMKGLLEMSIYDGI